MIFRTLSVLFAVFVSAQLHASEFSLFQDAGVISEDAPPPRASPQSEAEADSADDVAPQTATRSDDKKTNGAQPKVNIFSSIIAVTTDYGGGTAFFAEKNGKFFIATNMHIMMNPEGLRFSTINGDLVKIPGAGYAGDSRDVYIMPVASLPEGLKALPIMENLAKEVQVGDEIVICGNPLSGGVFHHTFGKLLAVGPEIIELDCPVFRGNSGSPVYHIKSGKVIGVVSHFAYRTDIHSKNARSTKGSPIKRATRYFGMRMDSVRDWSPITPGEIAAQTKDLEAFNKKIEVIKSSKKNDHREIPTGYVYSEYQKVIQKYWQRIGARNVSSKGKNLNALAERELAEDMVRLVQHETSKLKGRKFCAFMQKDFKELLEQYESIHNYYSVMAKSISR